MNYQQDFYTWTQEQAALLKAGDYNSLDIDNLIEEIEDMGNSKADKLESHLRVLLMHLLKWQYQPGKNFGRSWLLSIVEQRVQIKKTLKKNPGLKPKLPELIFDAYELALIQAEKETGISGKLFPPECPWTFEQIIDDEFFPD
jgi:predicted DNA-binding ribbon-helix-helix protein